MITERAVPAGEAVITDTPADPESNLVSHARRELERIGEEPDTIDWYLSVVRAFTAFGHGGVSSAVMLPVLERLLRFKPAERADRRPRRVARPQRDQRQAVVAERAGLPRDVPRRGHHLLDDARSGRCWRIGRGPGAPEHARTQPHRTEHPLNLGTRLLAAAALATVPIVAAAPAAFAHDDVAAEANVETDEEDYLDIEFILDLGEDEDLIEL